MNKPVPVEEGVTFDLHAIAQELRSDESYRREGQAARTLVRTPDLRIVVVVLQAGKTISEHHVDVTAAVQTLSGRVRLQLPDRVAPLSEGQVLVLGPGLSHEAVAEIDSVFLLTLGWPVNK